MKKYNKHLIIVGSARSGTSWLAETMAAQHRYRLLFEPEHEFNTKQGKLICDRYITRENASPEIEKYFELIFSNRVDNDWIAQASNRKYKFHLWPLIPRKYIIKFVRANLAAHYMSQEFQIPLIHIIRNPYDVLYSQQRVKFSWLFDLSHFTKQEELVELIYSMYSFDLRKQQKYSDLEVLTIRWCLENVIPLKVNKPYISKSKIVKHEELRNNKKAFVELCEFFDLQPITDLDSRYRQPSSKTHPQSEIRINGIRNKKFDQGENQAINYILDIFRCNLYPREI